MFLPSLPSRQYHLDDHTEALEIRKESIKRLWNKRDNKKHRELLRWAIQQAQMHKHMIMQISSLPELPSFNFFG